MIYVVKSIFNNSVVYYCLENFTYTIYVDEYRNIESLHKLLGNSDSERVVVCE